MNRKEKITQLRNEGKTYQQIGNVFHISRQRIHQILNGYKSSVNEERRRKTRKEYREKLRVKIITYYGGKCKKCGFDNINCLEIDHIDNNGAKERKKFGGAFPFWKWLIKNNYPAGYQVLCRNCNWLKYLAYKNGV